MSYPLLPSSMVSTVPEELEKISWNCPQRVSKEAQFCPDFKKVQNYCVQGKQQKIYRKTDFLGPNQNHMKQHDLEKSLETSFALNNASHHRPLHRNAHYTELRYTHREIRSQTEENPRTNSTIVQYFTYVLLFLVCYCSQLLYMTYYWPSPPPPTAVLKHGSECKNKWFIEDQAFSPLHDLAPSPPPTPFFRQ